MNGLTRTSQTAKNRVINDLKKIRKNKSTNLVLGGPLYDNLMIWSSSIIGPNNSSWDKGVFKLFVFFSNQYPTEPPIFKFIGGELFHPNVYQNGDICIDILQNRWSPIFSIDLVLTSIQSLLLDPNPNSPANLKAAKIYSKSYSIFNIILDLINHEKHWKNPC
mmetsp:Transcript_16563/g.25732  ORF Transcript_16563/g.25732 Transcript_16563/m.25732 type:complete len:163 (-) Transcript_16563:1921-2409(-)